jgi:uncharacterized protein (TIGR03437 family)
MRNTAYAILLSGLFLFTNLSNAQSGPIAVSPTQLTFNTSGSAAPPSQNLLVTSTSASVATFAIATFSTGNWLSVTPGSGSTPQVLSVSVNPGALTAGVYGGFINITSGGSSVTVPVTLNVNSGGAPGFAASPGSVTFNFQTGSNIPQSQPVAIFAAGGGSVPFSATANTNNGAAWLSVNPSSGTTPNATLIVSVNPTNLAAGSYFGVVAINAPGMTGLLVPVQVNISPPASVNVTPSQLSFAFQLGTTAPTPQTLNITSTGGGTIAFTATPAATSCGGNWLVVSPQSSATPAAVSVQINTVSLTAGNCPGTINISAPGASNPSQSIPVNLLVSTNPLLLVPTTGVTFNYQLGSTAVPAPQTVQVTSSSTPLNFNAAATPVSGGPNFLTVSPATGTTPQAITLSLNTAVLAGLAPNTYAENVTVSSSGAGNPPQTFTVTLVVSNNATLVASQSSLTFNYQLGQAAPPSQTITLTSTGPPLAYLVTTSTTNCSGFLTTAAPSSGITATQPGQQTQIAVSVNVTGLTVAQTCTGTVSISSPGSANPPVTIAVTLNVSSTPLLNVSPSAVTVIAVAGVTTMTTQPISLTSTDGSALNISATAVTNPPGLTWLSVTPQTGSTPLTLNVTVSSSGLAFGTYTGSIMIASSSPNVPAQTVPVTLIVASGTIAATPAALTFSQPLGGSVPASQTIQVTGVPMGATVGAAASMLNGAGWLNASISGTTITVSATGSSLTQGTYSGVITVIVPGASNSPLYVPVTFVVGGAPLFTVTPSAVNFAFQQNTILPPPQTIQLASAGNVTFTAVAVAPPGTAGIPVFITVTPAAGTTPANLSISLIASVVATLGPGTYTNFISLSSSPTGATQTFTVTLVVTPPGPPAIAAVVNSATFLTGSVSPGEIITIYGSNIGPQTPISLQLTASGMVATTLGNTSVTFNGFAAPLIYVSPNQVNAIVPYEIAGLTTANVVVSNGGAQSVAFVVTVTNTSPAIFTLTQNGTGQGAILNQDLSINGSTNAAARGSVIAIYGTGEGSVTPAVPTGSVTPTSGTIPKPVLPVTVTIGGMEAVINYAGEAPGLVAGVIQVNAVVPLNIAPGNQIVVVSVGGVPSPAVVTAAIK